MPTPTTDMPLYKAYTGDESNEEVMASRILSRCEKGTWVYPDGARAWKVAADADEKRLRVKPVIHQKNEFVRWESRDVRGTQMLDRRWSGLDAWVGKQIHTFKDGKVNPQLMQKVRSWQWRVRKGQSADLFLELGKACR